MPRYAGPLAVLLADDVLVVACCGCGHHTRIEVRTLPDRVRSGFTVEQFEQRLWCTRCGKRGSSEVVAVEAKDEREPNALKP